MSQKSLRRVLCVVMDGVGEREDGYGNAVKWAHTPWLDWLKKGGASRTLLAHGRAVGLSSDEDMGNSEVGHNALGSGQIYDQGAKLVQHAIQSSQIFQGAPWLEMMKTLVSSHSTLHFLGLLSDGNVHSHISHLEALILGAKKAGIKKVRIHILLDGRDVPEHSSLQYVERLEGFLAECKDESFDAAIASGGGRMHITMDRYEADWQMVQRGYDAHVFGKAEHRFASATQAIKALHQDGHSDQYLPSFVICEQDQPVGCIRSGDGVILFNFRGDRAIEISRAFCDDELPFLDRGQRPEVYFAGMMEYDGDAHIPKKFLVEPPLIEHTLGEGLAREGVRQFACSETQKFGHVTYFWNGNRSGYFDPAVEEYLEIPSDLIPFHLKPWMKAHEITDATIERMVNDRFDFARINFANGDMVGHTGDFEAALMAVATVDLMIGRLVKAAEKSDTILVVTADHGNADEMFAKGGGFDGMPPSLEGRPPAKTSHSLSPVPFVIYDPKRPSPWSLTSDQKATIAQLAPTVRQLMGLRPDPHYLPSLIS